jgi:hypothetical protein
MKHYILDSYALLGYSEGENGRPWFKALENDVKILWIT